MEMTKKHHKALLFVLVIYAACFVFRIWEYFFLRTDKTWVGEAIVHKLIGIVILALAVKMLNTTWEEIGYSRKNVWQNILKGLGFGLAMFAIAYTVEIMLATCRGENVSLQVYVSTYAVDQNVGKETALVFFLICIVGNIINVMMEGGVFRGLFMQILQRKYSFALSAVISSVLFGLWHMIGPIRNYYDGISSMNSMIANILMLVVTSGLVGFKFALLSKMTGNLYMALSDHFVNNTIVNLLHVVSNTGTDEMMFVRLTIAQALSCTVVLLAYLMRNSKCGQSSKCK